ncbi:MAG: hypothetical protein HRU03_03040 [Nanoarchaeales archaeon]|nr:hypothetical protein [Nanoarchaeales archaeon]
MKNIFSNKSGQIFILSGFLLILSLVFIYSLETDNSYITDFTNSIIIENIIYETCNIAYNSNGSQFDSRFLSYQNHINLNCLNNNYNCLLTITKQPSAPADLSLLSYSDFDFDLYFENKFINYSNTYTC